jgi:general secretion pathway protein H
MLVVVTIIGMFVGVAMLSTDLVSFDRKIEQEVERLAVRIRFSSEEALMQSRDFGIVLYEEGYEFRTFQYGQGWLPADGPGMEALRLEPDMLMRLTIDGREVVLEPYCELFPCGAQRVVMDEEERIAAAPDPQIVIFSSGELTPFEIAFYRESEYLETAILRGYQLSAEFDGKTELDWYEF